MRYTALWMVGMLAVLFFHALSFGGGRIWSDDTQFQQILERYFDVNDEGNFGAIFSGILMLTCSFFCILVCMRLNLHRFMQSIGWAVMGAVFCFLAFDEMLGIHEQLDRISFTLGETEIHWVGPGIIILTIFGLCMLPFILNMHRTVRTWSLTAGTIYVMGAVVLEIIGIYFVKSSDDRGNWLLYTLTYTVEETMEMLGLVVFFHILYVYASELKQYLPATNRPTAEAPATKRRPVSN